MGELSGDTCKEQKLSVPKGRKGGWRRDEEEVRMYIKRKRRKTTGCLNMKKSSNKRQEAAVR